MNFHPFGPTPDGEQIVRYTLVDPSSGASVSIITYGAIITSIHVPDFHGELADVVLGFDQLADYLKPHPYFGAIAGRVAGRITQARFNLDHQTFVLAANDPPNHLHGGPFGFDRHVWRAQAVTRPDGAPSLRLSTTSADQDQGYPGNVTVAITYTLTADLCLIVETEATTDAATPINLTQHSYFNLSGEGSRSTLDHELEIFSPTFALCDDHMTLLGQRESSVGRPNDFSAPRRLRDAIPGLHRQHGDLYFTRDPKPLSAPRQLQHVARLTDPCSGRQLNVHSDEDCLQFYTGVSLDGSLIGKSGRAYEPFAGICLECEGYPDGPNTPTLGDIILTPGQTLRRTTHYAFSAIVPS